MILHFLNIEYIFAFFADSALSQNWALSGTEKLTKKQQTFYF